MEFRTVVINKAKKVNLDLNNIVICYENENYWINLDEISNLIIEDPRCMVSLKLLTELSEKGVNVILTNSSHNPVGVISTLNNHARSPKKYKEQINWDKNSKSYLWEEIIKQKIKSQIQVLEMYDKCDKLDIMNNYLENISENDITNREGLASRTYFKELFGNNFKRFNDDIINYCLNYTYQIIRGKISQLIVALGYNPVLGINHKSEYNYFNLSDDFIEVFRPIVDYFVYEILELSKDEYLTHDLKMEFANILNRKVLYKNMEYKINNVILFYLQDLFSFLETGNVERINFPKLIWII